MGRPRKPPSPDEKRRVHWLNSQTDPERRQTLIQMFGQSISNEFARSDVEVLRWTAAQKAEVAERERRYKLRSAAIKARLPTNESAMRRKALKLGYRLRKSRHKLDRDIWGDQYMLVQVNRLGDEIVVLGKGYRATLVEVGKFLWKPEEQLHARQQAQRRRRKALEHMAG